MNQNPFVTAIFSKALMKLLIVFASVFLFLTIAMIPISIKLFKSTSYFSGDSTFTKNNFFHSKQKVFIKIFFVLISFCYALTVGWILCVYAIVFGFVSYLSIIFKRNGSIFWNSLPLLFFPLFYDVKTNHTLNTMYLKKI